MSHQVVVKPFQPIGTTVNLAVLATTANVQIAAPVQMGFRSIRIVNVGTNTVFVNFGVDNTVTASVTTSNPILPNSEKTFYLQYENSWVAAIAAGTGNTIYITTGNGT